MLEQMMCCGVCEESEIRGQTPEDALRNMVHDLKGEQEWRRAFIIFTDHNKRTYGIEFAKYIQKLGLGPVIKTRPKINPNTGNVIQVWVWSFNAKKLKAYARKKGWIAKRSNPDEYVPYW